MAIDYGRELSCTDALNSARYVTGVRVVAEAIYRRLITRRGELIGAPDYGLLLEDYLGSTTSAAEVARLPGLIKQECMKDSRVESVDVIIEETTEGAEREWTITIDCYTGAGPFSLKLAVSEVTTELLGIT